MIIWERLFCNGMWKHTLAMDENFFLLLFTGLASRKMFGVAAIAVKVGKLLHSGSEVLRIAPVQLLQSQRRYAEAIVCGQRLTAQRKSSYLSAALARCLDESGGCLEAKKYWDQTERGKDAAIDSAYMEWLLRTVEDSSLLLDVHQQWAKTFADFPVVHMPVEEKEHLRIGFYCSFFDSATIRNQLLPWVPAIEKLGHQVLLYVGDGHLEGKQMASAYPHVRTVCDLSDREFVELVRGDRLDVVVDVTGFSPGHRFRALAQRVAPIQVTYLNHAATSGVNNIDFILADDLSIAPGEEQYYSETVYRMCHCFFCFNFEHEEFYFSPELPFDRNGYWTFGLFGSGTKLHPVFIEMMTEALKAIPDSRLIIANYGMSCPHAREILQQKFVAVGIDPARLRLLPGCSRADIAKLHGETDLTFDSYPYCGGNTLSESLWYGVPGVSLLGNRFASRYGASILHACELDEYIATSLNGYVDVIKKATSKPERLREQRRELRGRMTASGGYSDVDAFAADFLVACRGMQKIKQETSI